MNIVFKKVWPELKPFTKSIIFILLLGLVSAGFKSASPPLMKMLTGAWTSGDQDTALLIPWVLAGVWTMFALLKYIQVYWLKYISDIIAVKLRKDLMDKYLSLNLGFFQDFIKGSGGLISRMINDISVIQGGIHKFADLLREPFIVVFCLIQIIIVDWKLTVFIFIAMPIIIMILKNIARSLRKYGHRNQESMEDLTKTLKESLDGTRIVQSFNLQGKLRDRFQSQADRFLETRKKIISREEAAGPASESLSSLALAFLLIYLGNQIIGGQLQIDDFVGFLASIGLLSDSIRKIQGGYVKLQQAGVGLERMHSILESTSQVPDPDTPRPFPKDWKSIEFRNVSFSFGDRPILRNIDLTVRKGEKVALVGSSGGGKSTLVNLVERFFDPSEGDILIDGVNLKEMKLEELRKHIALVTQDVFLFSESVRANIESGDLDKTNGSDNLPMVEDAAKLANAHEFICQKESGYDSRVGDQGSLFSGGEKQRISIARAIYKDAPILILDEATSALDSESELEVQKGLEKLMEGRTAFVIAHRLSTISKVDRILVLKEGQIIEQGTHQDLLANQGEYFKFYQMQTH